jgi:hypothetical protein
MTEQTSQQARQFGAGIAILVLVGTLVVGTGALVFAFGMLSEKQHGAAGSGIMAAAIAYGFAANAIWRR